MMEIWIATSNDEFKLIEDMDVHPARLAERRGVAIQTLYSSEKHHKQTGKDTRYMKVEIEEDERE